MGHKIKGITKNSIAEKLGVPIDGALVSINGKTVKDVFDYRFAMQDEHIELAVSGADGKTCVYKIEKDYFSDIGLIFETDLMDAPQSCRNKCVFCFIDQLPQGMRRSLYFKDDDPRLSFLSGNYVTLTNISDKELDRLTFYHLSPINISVHTTDPALRQTMLNNKHALKLPGQIKKIAAAGITMNFQVVLCRGINDGAKLDETITALSRYIPCAASLSVVPSGLTKHRGGCYPLTLYTKSECADIIKQVEGYQKQFLERYKTRFVYAADEFYVKAGGRFPAYKTYEDFYQIENGVGMAAMTLRRLKHGLLRRETYSVNKSVSIVTGVCAYPLMQKCRDLITQHFPALDLRVHKVKNTFFGDGITVSGLLTGYDIINALKNENPGDIIILPENVLKANTQTLLDDITAGDIKNKLGRPVYFCGDDDFLETVLNGGRI